MKSSLWILHLEDEPRDVELVQETLLADGIECAIKHVETEADFLASLEQGGFDLILADYSLPAFDGLSALKAAKRKCPHIPLIFVSGAMEEELPIDALKMGGTDYVSKTRLSRIVPSVKRALREAEERAKLARAEEALQQAQAALAHVTRVATMGELMTSIAHEINQPLSAIMINAGSCVRWLGLQNVEEARRSASLAIEDARRASEIIRRIRTLAKKAPPEKGSLDLNQTISEVIAMTHSELKQNGILLHTRLANDLPLIMGDRIQLQQVILNLLINAIEAMSGGGESLRQLSICSEKAAGDIARRFPLGREQRESERPVRRSLGEGRDRLGPSACSSAKAMEDKSACVGASGLETERRMPNDEPQTTNAYLLVSVADSGPGLDPSALHHLFDAFYSTKPQGLGMGLAISRSIVEAHGGQLWATVNEPKGALFQFTLPTTWKD